MYQRTYRAKNKCVFKQTCVCIYIYILYQNHYQNQYVMQLRLVSFFVLEVILTTKTSTLKHDVSICWSAR